MAFFGHSWPNLPDETWRANINPSSRRSHAFPAGPAFYTVMKRLQAILPDYWTSSGSVPVAWPLLSVVILSTRASACRSNSSQRRFNASPRS